MKKGITNVLLVSLAMVFVALPAGAQVSKPSPATSELGNSQMGKGGV